jgi:signal transduction histidine kinase/CheY-like chemotaxis protein
MAGTATVHDGAAFRIGNLQELRQPILESICGFCIATAWVWWLVALPERHYPPSFQVLAPPVLPSVAAAIALLGRRLPLPLRSAILLLGAEGTFLLAHVWDASPVWLYYQSLVVVTASLLLGPRIAFLFALFVSAASLATISTTGALTPLGFLPIAGLIWATAAVSWLSSRSLFTALDWSLTSQAQTWQTLSEVQRRREQLRSTLDSLRHAHDALERTTRDLQAATLEAEEARRAKSRFVASISHELRTPLNVIVGFAELLTTSPATYGDFAWPPALLGDLLTIWRNAEHLLKMIDDILDLAQIEAAHFPLLPEVTDLNSLIGETVTASSSLVHRSGLELRLSLTAGLPPLNVDGTRIRQVLINLLNNAVRYTSAGFIEVGSECREHDVLVYVRDSGRGIPRDRLETIFEEFEQADTAISRSRGGAGLGLAISRQFIRLHGGRIWAESAPGEGSTFYFTLPISMVGVAVQPAYSRRPWSPVASGADEARPVLVLCQDAAIAHTIERHLEGKEVVVALTPEEATQAVGECHPDALLIAGDAGGSLLQAAEDGRALLQAIAPFDVPVLVSHFPTERRASLALQVSDFLLKPVSRRELLAAIRRVCQTPKRVLVVDDEPDMLRLLTRIVREEWGGCDLTTAASADEALELLSPRPSVILLDLLMPGANGLDLLGRLKADASLAQIPTIVVTARGPAEDVARAERGELRLLRGASFTASDITRVLESVTKVLPPHYGVRPVAGPEPPVAAPAAPASRG